MRFHPKRIVYVVLTVWLLTSGAFYYWTKLHTGQSSDNGGKEATGKRSVDVVHFPGTKQLFTKPGDPLARLVDVALVQRPPPAPSKHDSQLGQRAGVHLPDGSVKGNVEEQVHYDDIKPIDSAKDKEPSLSKKTSPTERMRSPDIYPSLERYSDDRILKQLNFVAPSVRRQRKQQGQVKVKKIFAHPSPGAWSLSGSGSKRFQDDRCLVQDCQIISERSSENPLREADVVLTKGYYGDPARRPPGQVWAVYLLESPHHTPVFPSGRLRLFNWTATYRHDSTIVAPYEKYVPLNASLLTRTPLKNYASGKTKKVAWFVSNCMAQNNRLQYAHELSKHIEVDIYGGCGDNFCPRFEQERCFQMLDSDYKFYLAFENSNCRDYITEKFFINGLQHDVIPIAMGAHPEDYRRAAPPHSFIHVDQFDSPKDLAAYLHKLDQNDHLFNQYFAWKGLWTNINTFFWCRVCQLAHDIEDRGPSWFEDVEKWWRGADVCTKQERWKPLNRTRYPIGDLAVEATNT